MKKMLQLTNIALVGHSHDDFARLMVEHGVDHRHVVLETGVNVEDILKGHHARRRGNVVILSNFALDRAPYTKEAIENAHVFVFYNGINRDVLSFIETHDTTDLVYLYKVNTGCVRYDRFKGRVVNMLKNEYVTKVESEIDNYLQVDESKIEFTLDGKPRITSVKWGKLEEKPRYEEAIKQIDTRAKGTASAVFDKVNKLFDDLNIYNRCIIKPQVNRELILDGVKQDVVGHGFITKDIRFNECIYDEDTERYTYHDPKYDVIQKEFDLRSPKDVIWIKFTKDGYIGVVARGFDINFRYDNSAGILVIGVQKEWDSSFVLVFPITKELQRRLNVDQIERIVGNYILSQGYAIIDADSHLNPGK